MLLLMFLAVGADVHALAAYPVTVTDLAGRQVVIPAPPERIVLQDSNHLMALALLDREDPLARIVAWNNSLAGSDPSLWNVVVKRWPQADKVPTVSFGSEGNINSEAIIAARPDLVIARLESRSAIESGSLGPVLESLGVPVLYVSSERDPLENVPATVSLLGEALDRRDRARAYVSAYETRLDQLLSRAERLPPRRVFVEVRAGQAGDTDCCHTHGDIGWGLMVKALGAENVGSTLLGDIPSGQISVEALAGNPPDLYVMTGTQRMRNGRAAIPFGYAASQAAIDQTMQSLLERKTFGALMASQLSCVIGLNHQFYNSVFNVVGVEYLAKALWPAAFDDLDPDASYRELIADYTSLPADEPFIFAADDCADGRSVSRSSGEGESTGEMAGT